MVVEPSVSIAILAEHVFAVAEELRPHQTVELRDAAGKRTALYSRYLVTDGSNWARHGLYQQFYSSGSLAAEGTFEHDLEHGPWRGLHENGRLAALGLYYRGQQAGKWRYWSPEGREEASELFPEPPGDLKGR